MDIDANDVAERATKLAKTWLPSGDEWRERLEEVDGHIRHVVRHNAIITLFGALCLGYVVGRAIARR